MPVIVKNKDNSSFIGIYFDQGSKISPKIYQKKLTNYLKELNKQRVFLNYFFIDNMLSLMIAIK